MKRIAISTLGCKTNQAESSIILSQFDPNQYTIVPFESGADIYIINTCTVTNRTDYKSRALIRKALSYKTANPFAKVIVTGCYAQRSKDEISSLGPIDMIIDNQNKLNLSGTLDSQQNSFEDIMLAEDFNFKLQTMMHERARAFQKIQDGCDYYCSYCAVPYARGHARSAKHDDVIHQAKIFVQSGYKEIVLGGVNLGLYNDHGYTLSSLLIDLESIDGLEIIRLSSLEPQLLTDTLLATITNSKIIAPHFHIAFQSGSDKILQSMKRVYTVRDIQNLISKIHDSLPHAAIGGDLICGFPGESEQDFDETYSFYSELAITYLHVFSYSKRKGTPAASMKEQIHGDVMRERTNRMLLLSESKLKSYKQRLIDDKVQIKGVIEDKQDELATFLSDHFVRVYTNSLLDIGDIASIIPSEIHLDGLK